MIELSLYHPALWDIMYLYVYIINRNNQTLVLKHFVPDALLLVIAIKSFKKLKLQNKNK